MILPVVFSQTALETLDIIRENIVKEWGEKALKQFQLKVIRAINLIVISPYIFQSVGKNENMRKGWISKQGSFFYEIKNESIYILFFWDNRQEPIF